LGGIIVRNYTVRRLDETDLQFADVLTSLGVKKNVATLLAYLKNVDEAVSRDIEISTGLRQPEVSIAMCALRQKGWISERDVKGAGKGRPNTIYSLSTHIADIIRHYEELKQRDAEKIKESIERLKALVTS